MVMVKNNAQSDNVKNNQDSVQAENQMQSMQSNTEPLGVRPLNSSGARTACSSMGEGVTPNMFASSQRQMQRRPHVMPRQPQNQTQSANYMYQQQMPQQLPRQNLEQPFQHQMTQHTSPAMFQPFGQSVAPSCFPSGYTTQQYSHAVVRQQEQVLRRRMISSETQHNHFSGWDNSADQHQNNIATLLQQQQQQQQAMLGQNIHRQRHGHRSNVSYFTPQRRQKMQQSLRQPLQQQQQQLGLQEHVNLRQPLQQQQQQQQLGLQEHVNLRQHDMRHQFHEPGPLIQTHNIVHQQNQLYQSQRGPENLSASEGSTGKTRNVGAGDWQEDTYQKISTLKELYLPHLYARYQKLYMKLKQTHSDPQMQIPQSLVKTLTNYKMKLERAIEFLHVPRSRVKEMNRKAFCANARVILGFFKNQIPSEPMQRLPDPQMHPIQKSGRENAMTSLQQNHADTSRLMQPNMPQQQHFRQPQEQQQHIVLNRQQKQVQQRQGQIQRRVMQKQQMVQKLQLQQQAKQQLQTPCSNQTYSLVDLTMRQGTQAGLPRHSYSSPHLPTAHKNGTPSLSEKTVSPLSQARNVEHPQRDGAPLTEPVQLESCEDIPASDPPKLDVECPIDRLIKALQSSSPEYLAESFGEISSVINPTDRIAAPAAPSAGSRARDFETGEGRNITKNTKRSLSALPLDNVSLNRKVSPESEADSMASTCTKRKKIKPESELQREIEEIKQIFEDTELDIRNEDDINKNPRSATSTEDDFSSK